MIIFNKISVKHIIVLLMLVSILFSFFGIKTTLAASCYGESCEGLNPNTMGCSAITSAYKYVDNNAGYVEIRESSDCNAKWARTTNKYNGYLYIASTLYYGGSNYDYAKHVYSPATVPQNSVQHNGQSCKARSGLRRFWPSCAKACRKPQGTR